MLKHYISIARPGHWFKNIFILPGLALAFLTTPGSTYDIIWKIVFGVISVCLIASANYTINEWLDAEFDKFHPLKKHRPSVGGFIELKFVLLQYALLSIVGLALAYYISMPYFWISAFLLFMGIMYNVKPFRTKDHPYLDVLSESINNPIRLLLGWFIVVNNVFPPSSLIISYWMAGSFLMAVKRYSELRLISDKSTAMLYRQSFKFYTENNLLVSILFYAMSFAFFFGIFMIKYRIEFLLSMPFFAILFAWYLKIGMGNNSPAQRPEELYKEKPFMIFIVFLIILLIVLLVVDVPALHWFLNRAFR